MTGRTRLDKAFGWTIAGAFPLTALIAATTPALAIVAGLAARIFQGDASSATVAADKP